MKASRVFNWRHSFSVLVPIILLFAAWLQIPPAFSESEDPSISPTVNSSGRSRIYTKLRSPAYSATLCQSSPQDQQQIRAYKESFFKELLRSWALTQEYALRGPVFSIDVSRSGQLQSIRLLRTSGNAEIDRNSESAIAKVFPTRPLPETYWRDHLNMLLVYDVMQALYGEGKEPSYEGKKVTDWLKRVTRISRKNWNPVPLNKGITVKVFVSIDTANGKVLDTEIWKSSCDPDVDQAAIKAVEKSSPFPKPKFDNLPSVITVLLGFDYKPEKP